MSVAAVFIVFGFFWFMAMFAGRRARWGYRHEDFRRRRLRDREESETLDRINGLLTDMSARLDRIEEERDFYRELLGSGSRLRKDTPAEKNPS